MNCDDARKLVDGYFEAAPLDEDAEKGLNAALENHITVGTTPERHTIACRPCWKYLQASKRKHCGG